MVECGDRPRFLCESFASLRIRNEGRRQNFHCDVAMQADVGGAIDLAHSAGADGGEDLIRPQPGSW